MDYGNDSYCLSCSRKASLVFKPKIRKYMVTYSESFVEFLRNSDCKVAQTLYRAHNKPLPSHRLMVTTNEINYVTFRHDGNISFLPAGKEPKFTEDGRWAREGRQDGRPAKVIRKLFTEKAVKLFKPADFECFSNSYKSTFCEGLIFKLLPNTDIPEVYDMTLTKATGSLFNSCMNGRGRYMGIYKHCDCLSILILKNQEDLLCGRSLIWKLENITLMDRIYVTDDYMYDCFIAHAIQNGWWYKKHYNTFDYKRAFINSKGEEVDKQFIVYTATNFNYFPYIDTFSYGSDGTLNNYGAGEYEYCSSYGDRNYIDDNEK